MRTLGILAVALILPAAAAAQVVVTPRGWIGVTFEERKSVDDRGERSVLVIDAVTRGGPADQAGIRAGDLLVAVDGQRGLTSVAHLREHVHPEAGEEIALTIARDGTLHTYQVTAAPRTTSVAVAPRISVRVQPDSMVEVFSRSIDSLRLHLIESSLGTLRVVGETGDVSVVDLQELADIAVEVSTFPEPDMEAWVTREVQAPFEFRIFRGEAYDSLMQAMQVVNLELQELVAAENERVRELVNEAGTLRRSEERSDRELNRVRRQLDEVRRKGERIERAMVVSARNQAGRSTWRAPEPDPPEAAARAAEAARAAVADAPPEPRVEFRPLTPYLLGRDRVLGAQITDLQPELAQYFDVAAGVLVVEVPPRTPAAEAGVRPGDVIIQIDGRPVRSGEELRARLARSGRQVPLLMVRKGETIQVTLRF